MTGATKVKKVKAFWWLSGITIAYFAIYYLLILETKVCVDIPSQAPWFHGFSERYLGCRSVNELGDALAGAFAPVAFLWLAGAVFIQSKELEAQREELNETQQVMREQVDEMRASTGLMRQQTEAMQKDQLRKDQEYADKEFDERVKLTAKVFSDMDRLYLVQSGDGPEGMTRTLRPSFETTLIDYVTDERPEFGVVMEEFAARAELAIKYLERAPLAEGLVWQWEPSSMAPVVHTALNILNNESDGISPAHQLRRLSLGIPAAQAKFEKLQELIEDINKASSRIEE